MRSRITISYLLVSIFGCKDSTLGRTELLELRRRRTLCSHGSEGCSPVDLANMLRISVSETTPINLPDKRAPAIEAAGTATAGIADGIVPGITPPAIELCDVATGTAGVGRGDCGGAESTIHMRCDLVATNLATVCAKVE
ncbi:hypothetical protein Trco_008153 [Trichoderma cornu-damae]|uniref:Uncharacterized protein n=1 Tax=Trichoderma cornu-damae TaxID=654480 RepID=A0A9P8QI63_9HYPO|nr:hypothetical protein Trco_008153 [Trichoderma cornu-damae]